MSGDGDAGQNISHFEDLPPEIQALVCFMTYSLAET